MSLLNNTRLIRWVSIAFVVLGLFLTSFVQAQDLQKGKENPGESYKGEIEAGGYKYAYESMPASIQESREKQFLIGKITIRNNRNELVYQEITPFQPGMCSGFPMLSKWSLKNLFVGGDPQEGWLVTICGSYTGRHQTVKAFFKDSISMKSSTLNFEDTKPNLSDLDEDGFYEALVYRRLFFNDIGYGTVPYLTVYKLSVDLTLFGFIPDFGLKIKAKYFNYFLQLKGMLNSKNISDYIGPMLAALSATQDEKRICSEIKMLRSFGVTTEDLQAWEKRLNALGYPSFNLNICKEGLK